jgi:hypothetical protein
MLRSNVIGSLREFPMWQSDAHYDEPSTHLYLDIKDTNADVDRAIWVRNNFIIHPRDKRGASANALKFLKFVP